MVKTAHATGTEAAEETPPCPQVPCLSFPLLSIQLPYLYPSVADAQSLGPGETLATNTSSLRNRWEGGAPGEHFLPLMDPGKLRGKKGSATLLNTSYPLFTL